MNGFSWKTRFGTPQAHIVWAGLLAAALIVAPNFGAFVGHRCIPWDFLDHHYNEYLIALHSAQHSIFAMYNPYEFGGMFIPNIFAYYDPIFYWFLLLTRTYPDEYQHQLIHLAHYFVVPASLFFLAYLYGIRGKSFYLVAVLSAVAAYVGPTVELISQGGETETYAWGFALIAALECYRKNGNRWAIVAAALFLSWATIAGNEDIPYWPFAIVGYAIAFWPELRSRPRFVLDLTLGVLITILLTAPFLVESYGLFQDILASKHSFVNEAARVSASIAYFGYNDGISLFTLPGALLVVLMASLWNESVRVRWVLGITLGALYLYALGNVTPFEGIFRTLYYPASLFRRPYGALDIALPITFAFILRGYFASAVGPLVARNWFIGGSTVAFVASIFLQPQHISLNLVAFLLTLAVILLYRSRGVVAVVLLVQWFIAVFLPYRLSEMYPGAWPPRQLTYFNSYVSVDKYMAPITTDSSRLFRVAGDGVTADFSAKSGAYQYFMLYPGHSTFLPVSLVTLLHAPEIPDDYMGTRHLTAETIVGTVAARTAEMVGSNNVRQMAVRYYILGPTATEVIPKVLRLHPEFKVLPGGFWTVLYDPGAQSFIRTVDSSGRVTDARGIVDWDDVSVTTPNDARYLDVANLYDRWWHAYTSTGTHLPVISNDGELRVDVSGHGNERVTLHFGNQWFNLALLLELLTYAAIAGGLAISYAKRIRARRAAVS